MSTGTRLRVCPTQNQKLLRDWIFAQIELIEGLELENADKVPTPSLIRQRYLVSDAGGAPLLMWSVLPSTVCRPRPQR